MAIERAIVIRKMGGAFKEGMSFNTFYNEMKEVGLSYRRTDMLGDWRSVGEIRVKEDLFKYVRKDYYPTEKSIAQVSFALSREYMYKVKVESRLRPDMPLTERFVNIMTDSPMTPRMVEQMVTEKWREWEKYMTEQIEAITPYTALHRVTE